MILEHVVMSHDVLLAFVCKLKGRLLDLAAGPLLHSSVSLRLAHLPLTGCLRVVTRTAFLRLNMLERVSLKHFRVGVLIRPRAGGCTASSDRVAIVSDVRLKLPALLHIVCACLLARRERPRNSGVRLIRVVSRVVRAKVAL